MFIEFETYSEAGRTMLNVRHIVQIEKSNTGNDTMLILANGRSVLVKASYQEVKRSSAYARAHASSMAKLSPAMTTAWPRSISSVTTALTRA